MAESTQLLAAGEALAAALAQRIGELETRIARLRQRADETATERQRLKAATRNDAPLTAARQILSVADSALEQARAAARETEQARLDADAAAAAARERLEAAKAAHARLAAEAEALAAMFAAAGPAPASASDGVTAGQSEPWPPLVDALRVAPGFEAALGVALGDDLVASADDAAPVHWRLLPETTAAAPLPAGAEPLSRHVEGVPALARRLSQIGVVADDTEGTRLRGQLVQGQRLVSRDGAMWRWDGFTVAPGAPTAALTRLRQRGRLDALRPELDRAEAALVAAEREFAANHAAALAAAEAERARRQSQQAAYDTLGEARATHAAAAQAATATASLLAAAMAAAGDLAVALAEAESELTAARQGRAALSDLDAGRVAVTALRSRLGEQRAESMARTSAHDRLQREAEARTVRRAAIAEERRSWAERAAAAAQRLEAFAARRDAAEVEIER
ncbi:MAG: chromosome partitioning protein ParA, partial [Dongiaceae bacterium]